MTYYEFQKGVFDYLWNKHQRDKTFTFSVRQKASKGAEKNYFIGTEKSKYFGFTCWYIPVSYPGSSEDLTNFMFKQEGQEIEFWFQYIMSRAATDVQSEGDKRFGKILLEKIKSGGIAVKETPEKNKMFSYKVFPSMQSYRSLSQLLTDLNDMYERLAPLIDSSITQTRGEYPEWGADRYPNEKFNSMIEKMHSRIDKFNKLGELPPEELAPEEDDEVSIVQIDSIESKAPLNQILYGPPGTGKTYHTINKAVSIANPNFSFDAKTRQDIKDEYERLKKDGQIEFITFHQSMTYEDFIEGIKPKKPEVGDTFLKYDIEEGIFKKIAKRAYHKPSIQESRFSLTPEEYAQANFYKISLGNTAIPDDEQIYRYSVDNGYIALGWGGPNDFTGKSEHDIALMVPSVLGKFEAQSVNYFVHYLKVGDYVIVSYGNLAFRAIGRVTGEYEYKQIKGLEVVSQFRKVDWLLKDVEIPVEEVYNKQFQQQTIYKLNKSDIKQEFFVKNTVPVKQGGEAKKNYVLIIDEINRGNVSAIFGELITLIEEDKRQGNNEALEVMLPYSKEKFSVPSNLYLIGTMNTADRSVEALDTALRRRFVFEEMMAKPDLLSPIDDVDVQLMLTTINNRLTALLTKDHTIGHAWLMNLDNVEDLQKAFKNKILPLLQEYFYNSYAKIGLVLGDEFFEERLKVNNRTFAKFKDANEIADDYNDKLIYRLKNAAKLTLEDFRSIYS
jgi:hypothetical protein